LTRRGCGRTRRGTGWWTGGSSARAVGRRSAAGAGVSAEGDAGVAEKGAATSFANRSREPFSAHGAGVGTGLHGGFGGERRSCDRGHAGDAGRDRQRFAGGDGGRSGTAVRGAAGESDG